MHCAASAHQTDLRDESHSLNTPQLGALSCAHTQSEHASGVKSLCTGTYVVYEHRPDRVVCHTSSCSKLMHPSVREGKLAEEMTNS